VKGLWVAQWYVGSLSINHFECSLEKKGKRKKEKEEKAFLRFCLSLICVVSGEAKSHIVQRILPSFEPLRRREPLFTPLK